MTTAWTFQATSTIVIVGYNPENADYTNPRGAITGLMHFVQAHNEHGDTKELAVLSARDPEAAAQALADRLNTRFERLGRLPVGFDLWPAGRPIYGSEAYFEYGQADDIATEARELEDERFGY
jgi:hypothetical protein